MLTKEQSKQLIDRALSFSKAPECSINLVSSESAFTRYALNGITTSGFTVEQTMSISSTVDGKTGSTSVDEFTDGAIKAAVAQSEALAAISLPDPERVAPLGPQEYPALDNYDNGTAAARNAQMVPHIKAVIDGAKAKNLVAAGFFERAAYTFALGNKAGLFGHGRATDARLSTTVRAADGSSSGWASQPAVRIADIDGAKLGSTAVSKCVSWSKPRQLEPGKYTVVLEPTAVGDLVQLIGFAMNARNAEEGRSFLSKQGGGTKLGEQLFAPSVNLRTDPFDARLPGTPWSQEGLPNARIPWIEKGVVKNLWYGRYWAMKAQKAPTPFPGTLVMDGGTQSLNELIASVERGLLVTRFWYIRVVQPQTGQVTGLTRDGLFLIENGKVTAPVVNFRFNESPGNLLKNVVTLGQTARVRGGEGAGMIAPCAVVKDFPFTSVSDAV